jgi:hypothetical protein
MAPMAQSQWNSGGKTQRKRQRRCTRLPSVTYPQRTVVLHHARIAVILKWTKEHLDAYLASAAVIIDQRDEPG